MSGKKLIPASEYEQYEKYSFRDKGGKLYYVYMDVDDNRDDAPVYVKQVSGYGTHIDKVTLEQWSNAILNHGMYDDALSYNPDNEPDDNDDPRSEL